MRIFRTSCMPAVALALALVVGNHPSIGFLPLLGSRQSASRQEPARHSTETIASRGATQSPSLLKLSAEKKYDQGEVGKGSNWIEKSFPVETEEKIDVKKVEDYNLGISGKDFQTGSLSKRMFDTIVSRTSLEMSDEIKRAFTLYALDFTAKEATRAALKQNGLDMVLQEEEEDQGMWGDVEAVRLYDMATEAPYPRMYDSLEDAVEDWTPGQTFDFIARQVPAKIKELSMDELVQALDPDGKLREEAKEMRGGEPAVDEEALLSIFDEGGISSLADLANDCVARTESAPRGATDETDAYTGSDSRGYRVINRSDLLRDSINQDGTENEKTTLHVMNALVAHGVLLVDLTDGGTAMRGAEIMSKMWAATDAFYAKLSDESTVESMPGMTTVMEAGSLHAKVGYAEVDNGSMKFLETRRQRKTGALLPTEVSSILGDEDVHALLSSFDIVSNVGKDVTRIAVSASSVEHGAFVQNGEEKVRDQQILASQAATLLAEELVDNGKPLSAAKDLNIVEGDVSMSPHRLCRYAEETENVEDSREVFGAHTDSSFVTIVPVAAISGLEVFDEEAEKWYRPELRARAHWEEEQSQRGRDPASIFDENEAGDQFPWHARYLAIMPGEHLQLATRDEVPAAVHRVVTGKGRPPRLSAPILLRGRPGTIFDTERYLGGNLGSPLLEDADGLAMDEIHDKAQPSSYQ